MHSALPGGLLPLTLTAVVPWAWPVQREGAAASSASLSDPVGICEALWYSCSHSMSRARLYARHEGVQRILFRLPSACQLILVSKTPLTRPCRLPFRLSIVTVGASLEIAAGKSTATCTLCTGRRFPLTLPLI